MTPDQINEYAQKVYLENVKRGWWDSQRSNFTLAQLCNTEVAEATEGDRKNKMDEHLPHRESALVELADVFIRAMDWAGSEGWKYDIEVLPHKLLRNASTLPDMHFVLTCCICDLGKVACVGGVPSATYSRLVSTIMAIVAIKYSTYGLFEDVIREKLEYNRIRADHNRENRAAFGGKKY